VSRGATLEVVFEPSEMTPDVRWIAELVGAIPQGGKVNALSIAFFPNTLRAQVILGGVSGEHAQFTASVPWTNGRRTVFALRFDPSKGTLDAILNGFVESSVATRGLIEVPLTQIAIGRAINKSAASWKGTISEVRLTPFAQPDEYFVEGVRAMGLL